jgi:hypothetical protein
MIERRADWKLAEQSAALQSRDCCGQRAASLSGVRHARHHCPRSPRPTHGRRLARARLWVRNRTELKVTLEQQSRPIAETDAGIVRVKRYGFDMR